MKRLSIVTLCCAVAWPALSIANEGFSLGISGAMTATSPTLVNEAKANMQNDSNQMDTSLHELVGQPVDKNQAGVQNPLVLEPKKPWTQEQRDQFSALLNTQQANTLVCTQEVIQKLTQLGLPFFCT